MKNKLQTLSDDEKLELLSSDGMLVKRPLAVMGDRITLGFKKINIKRESLVSVSENANVYEISRYLDSLHVNEISYTIVNFYKYS